MEVYAALSGGLNVKQDESKDDEKEKEKQSTRNNDQWKFLNTSFLCVPFSASGTKDIFDKESLVLTLKAQFVNDLNETKYFDLSPFSSFAEKEGKNEILFYGEFSELSIDNISIQGDADTHFGEYFQALNYWQKVSTGFAAHDDKQYNLKAPTENLYKLLLSLLNEDEAVPKYIQQIFKFYNESKTGSKYHAKHKELLDVDFRGIQDKVAKEMSKELQEKLLNEDMSDVDKDKLEKIFTGKVENFAANNGEEQKW